MSRPIFSQSWHNVAELRPRLLPHTRVHAHTYRGQRWFVLQDTASGRYHRLSPAANALVARMNGSRTVQSLWDEACSAGGDMPTQDDVVELLIQLHSNDLMYCDVTPAAAELFERYRKRRRMLWKQWVMNPLSVRIPLLDPDAFLTRWADALSWLFTWRGAMLWLAVVSPALVLAAQQWTELTSNLSDQVLAHDNLLLLIVVFPFIKALHELGHGFAVKVWGGAVHEMGLMFLVFAPAPYVDASAASAFRSKHRRALVGAGGMVVETFFAALAMYVWLLVEPGLIRAIAFNVMFVAGVSTILTNGNPLLRYDGYYILCDLIEMPNLAQRGQKYMVYLCDRYLFGARDVPVPDETPSEKRWLVSYFFASWVYKIFVTLAIIVFVANEFFIIGVLLALWSAAGFLVVPLWKGAQHVLKSPALGRRRSHAIRVSLSLVALLLIVIFLVPLPLRTQAEGIVWLPDQAIVRAGANGTFERWLAEPGSIVQAGMPIAVTRDEALEAEWAVADARVEEAQARYRAQQFSDPAQADGARQQLEHERRALERVAERRERLVVRSEADGQLAVAKPSDMNGQFFKRGEVLAYVLDSRRLIVRVAVSQQNIDLVRRRLKGVSVRFADAVPQTHPASFLREVPSAQDELPTAALGLSGGGSMPTDPKDPKGMKLLERTFFVDLSLPPKASGSTFGGRVHVRFEHSSETLASQWHRRWRQLFLSHFHV